ncbi:MAG: protein phosphatase 2C domain-containing protein [Eubacterium sp.]|nr:protein phosphatase 2C domain-containing protein [Eubacterium sp.]
MRELRWQAASKKAVCHRKNQDAWYCEVSKLRRDRGIFVVADGVGSLDAPEIASRMAVSGVRSWWRETEDIGIEGLKALRKALGHIDQSIRDYGSQKGLCLATTLAVLLLDGDQGGILQIGDSKILRQRSRRTEVLTIDHLLEREGLLISCLGNARMGFDVMERYFEVRVKDRFFIGSDGVFSRKRLLAHYAFGQEEAYLKKLREAGEADDLTAIGVEVRNVPV